MIMLNGMACIYIYIYIIIIYIYIYILACTNIEWYIVLELYIIVLHINDNHNIRY